MSVFLSFAFLAAILAHIGCNNQRRGPEASGRRFNRIQHGQCTYTFILPEQDGNCRESTTDQYNTNALQRDAPHVEQDFSSQKLQHLEHVMENYTQWLQKEPALGLVELHTVDLGPSIQTVQISLQSLPTLQQINSPTQLCAVCELTEGALVPLIQIIGKDIKHDWLQY
ncbi:angiopoietin-1-like protein [Pitangus sulphuratus]|nr:angiopoietin-1-like protein [Pitangus sulphuratus]